MPHNEFPKILKRAELAHNPYTQEKTNKAQSYKPPTREELIENLNSEYFYFLRNSNTALGDTFFLLCLKDAIVRHLGAKIIFIISPYAIELFDIFDDKDYVICADLAWSADLPYCASVPTKGKIHPAHWVPLGFNPKGEVFHQWFCDLLGLPLDTPLKLPKSMPALDLALKSRIESIAPLDKIVFYLPEASSTRSLPLAIFRADCRELWAQGYTIIVNAFKDDRYNIAGTHNLYLSLKDAFALATHCHSVISMRSGFCDIIAAYTKNLICYYPNDINNTKWVFDAFSFKRNRLNINAKELTIKARFFGLGGLERSIAYRFYKRLIMRGLWKRLKCPLALMRLYLRYKDTPEPSVENPAVLESYEYQLGVSVLRIYKAWFNPLEICRFLRDYPRIKRLKRLKEIAKEYVKREFKQ